MTDEELIENMKILRLDHSPDGRPSVRMSEINQLIEIIERHAVENSGMKGLLRDIYRVCGASSRASHREQTAIFKRLRESLGISL